jgi:hypothetical protein
MATILLPPDFKEFLRLLNSREVQYLLIGGYAVNYYGYPRATADLDIWIAIDPLNAEKIALGEFGFKQATSSLLQEHRGSHFDLGSRFSELLSKSLDCGYRRRVC